MKIDYLHKGSYGNEKVLELLIEIGGRAKLDDLVKKAKLTQSPLERTHIWDRLIVLSRKGKVRNESGIWIVISS